MDNKFSNQGSVDIGNQIDNTNNYGQVNIANDNAIINATQNISTSGEVLKDIDVEKLIEELNILKSKLVEKEMYIEAGAIKEAIETSQENKKIDFLKKAGQKTLEIAQKVSLPVATLALTKSLGL